MRAPFEVKLNYNLYFQTVKRACPGNDQAGEASCRIIMQQHLGWDGVYCSVSLQNRGAVCVRRRTVVDKKKEIKPLSGQLGLIPFEI
jgi:hypothetical protein